jgi:predicted nucleotidyltransferase
MNSLDYLYGSVARGTDTGESVIDIAIILRGAKKHLDRERLMDFAVEMDLKYDKVFSVIDN